MNYVNIGIKDILMVLLTLLIIATLSAILYYGWVQSVERAVERRIAEAPRDTVTVWRDTTIVLEKPIPFPVEIPGVPVEYDTTYFVEKIDSLEREFESKEEVVEYLAEPFEFEYEDERIEIAGTVEPIDKMVTLDYHLLPFDIKIPEREVEVLVPVYKINWTARFIALTLGFLFGAWVFN